ncbi:hypothetical protein FEM48_Zijuj06G0142600 [Ziziphus jujuba var. spinosa]|uniref:Uncharacterized protein n=1 Tax=Ziziphus jujuba var. spinosa TaxID=714518 RepID=A0A978V9S0_ZIZJJ|nr:hypothetical protein FEM48_Zijuj06G0142600 [Ziziphus jujuba var. spinosa]
MVGVSGVLLSFLNLGFCLGGLWFGNFKCKAVLTFRLGSLVLSHAWGVLIIFVVKPDSKQSRGCLGCFTKPTLIIAVDEPSKGLKIQGRAVRKSSVSEDIWSSSTLDMDNSALQSQRSISLISTSNQALDPQSTSTSTLNPPEFVNHGKFMLLASHLFWLLT